MRSNKVYLAALALAALSLTGCRATRVGAAAFHSGAPSRAERRVIDDRTEHMLRDLPRQRIVVLPAVLIGRPLAYDVDAARTLAALLRSDSLANAVAASQPLELAFEPSSNEAAIFWSRFKALATSIRESPQADADYVMLIDVFGAPGRGGIDAVHVMVVNSRGEMAYHAAWNPAHRLHKQVRPQSVDDAVRMVLIDLIQRRTTANQIGNDNDASSR